MEDEELLALRDRLKSGKYDGGDIAQAWLAIDALIVARREIDRLRTAPAVPESAVQDVWEHGRDTGVDYGREPYYAFSKEVGSIFAEALKEGK
jgi:hypothetical protein